MRGKPDLRAWRGVAGRQVVVDRRPVSLSPALRAAFVVALLFGAGALSGCGNACLSLAQQICQCLPEDGTRAACNQRAKEGGNGFSVRPADETYCQQKLDENACDCHNLNTTEGKLACGLGYPATP